MFRETGVTSARVGMYAGWLALAEVGVGSLLHALYVPFTGYLLSLNQVLILTKAAKEGINGPSVSTIASLLKSLSPMGKRLTPMLAIAIQGFLYAIGLFLGNRSFFGRCLGACFLASWGFVQPILLYYLIFGSVWFEAIFHYFPAPYLYIFLGLALAFKWGLALGIVLVEPYISINWWQRWIKAEKVKIKTEPEPSFVKDATKSFKDLLRFPFLISLVFVSAYGFALEGFSVAWVLYFSRAVALAYSIFFLLRTLPLHRLVERLSKKPWKFTLALLDALKFVAQKEEKALYEKNKR